MKLAKRGGDRSSTRRRLQAIPLDHTTGTRKSGDGTTLCRVAQDDLVYMCELATQDDWSGTVVDDHLEDDWDTLATLPSTPVPVTRYNRDFQITTLMFTCLPPLTLMLASRSEAEVSRLLPNGRALLHRQTWGTSPCLCVTPAVFFPR
jgi:hypothetical protein